MTREEAITRLHWLKRELIKGTDMNEPIDMAIEALQADAVSLKGTMKYLTKPHNYCEVVRCKDCLQKHIGGSVTHYYWCDRWDMEVDDTDYCAWGERREK